MKKTKLASTIHDLMNPGTLPEPNVPVKTVDADLNYDHCNLDALVRVHSNETYNDIACSFLMTYRRVVNRIARRNIWERYGWHC